MCIRDSIIRTYFIKISIKEFATNFCLKGKCSIKLAKSHLSGVFLVISSKRNNQEKWFDSQRWVYCIKRTKKNHSYKNHSYKTYSYKTYSYKTKELRDSYAFVLIFVEQKRIYGPNQPTDQSDQQNH